MKFTSNGPTIRAPESLLRGLLRRPRLVSTILLCCMLVMSATSVSRVHASGPWDGLIDYSIVVDGYQRTYHVHVPPSYTGSTAVPLVLALHGSHDNGPNMAGLTGFNDVADKYGVIATYPDALNGTWNGDGSAPQDDFAFISAVINDVSRMYTINARRVYAMGFSNGGSMTEELGCRLSSQLAAIASVSAHMASTFACAPTHPMPFITFHGTADPIYSFAGYANAKYGSHLMGAVDAQDTWAALDSCYASPTTTNLPNTVLTDGTTEQLRTIGKCSSFVQTQLYIINGGGHTWPGGMQYAAVSVIGLTSLDIDASTLIWQFFARWQL